MADAVAFAFWGFFWFVSFCFMADQWRKVDSDRRDGIERAFGHSAIDNIQAAIAFTFFSILVWVSFKHLYILCPVVKLVKYKCYINDLWRIINRILGCH